MSGSWNAIVLAGSRGTEDPVARAAGVPVKALASLAGRPMISHLLDTLAAAPQIGTITIMIEANAPPLAPMPHCARRIDAAPTPATSVLDAALSTAHPLLITTADNPLLNQQILDEFISGAEAGACDIAAGLCPRAQVEKARNPGRRTYLKFRDGAYSGCNLFAVRTGQATGAIRFWQDVEADRKHPWRIARKIGLWPLALYAIGQLSRRQLEDTLGRRTGCRARLIDIHHPLAAHDVDKVSDLEFAEWVLNNQRDP